MEAISRELGGLIVGNRGQQRDYNHADDSQYKKLRADADRESSKYRELSGQAKRAYESGRKEEASSLSKEAAVHQRKADEFNGEAAQFVFRANNADSGPDEIDLHGLFVREALSALDYRISAGIRQNENHLNVIVGKGLHSENHIAKLKPAVEQFCQQRNLQWEVQHGNAGVLVVRLPGGPQSFPAPGQPSGNYGYSQAGNGGQHYQQQQSYGGQQGYGHQNNQHSSGGGFSSQDIKKYINIFRQLQRLFRGCF